MSSNDTFEIIKKGRSHDMIGDYEKKNWKSISTPLEIVVNELISNRVVPDTIEEKQRSAHSQENWKILLEKLLLVSLVVKS